jgi:succinate dehydrogenase hydrophobic anchor subunit
LSRLETAAELAMYLAAAGLLVVLPLHLLEHVPVQLVRQPPRPAVLWLVLVLAGIHGPLGLRRVLLERAAGRPARLAATALSLALAALLIAVGAWGLASSFGAP